MDGALSYRATLRTDDVLFDRVNNRQKYLPETVEASVGELKERGIVFSGEELGAIATGISERTVTAKKQTGGDGLFNRSDVQLQVEGPDAPAFYSKGTIYFRHVSAFSLVPSSSPKM